ncbi:MAG: hypothetical protein ACM3SP_10735 [Chloroflexota bacterium]|jgi:hypothetical protein
MTFADVLDWCKKNRAGVRGIYRNKDISISHEDAKLPAELPPIDAIFHWDLKMPELNHYVSSSDFERIVTGKLTIDGFKSTLRGNE